MGYQKAIRMLVLVLEHKLTTSDYSTQIMVEIGIVEIIGIGEH